MKHRACKGMVSGWSTLWLARYGNPRVGKNRLPSLSSQADKIWVALCCWYGLSWERRKCRIVVTYDSQRCGQRVLKTIHRGSFPGCSCFVALGPGCFSYFEEVKDFGEYDHCTFASIFIWAQSCWEPLALPAKPLFGQQNLRRLWCSSLCRCWCVAESCSW